MFQACFKLFSSMFQACFKPVLKKLLGYFKSASKVLERKLQKFSKDGSRLFKGSFNDISKVFQSSFEGVSRKFCSLIFLLHGTHCSYPSRRRACFTRNYSWFIVTRNCLSLRYCQCQNMNLMKWKTNYVFPSLIYFVAFL